MLLNYNNLAEILISSAHTDKGIYFIENKQKEDYLAYKELFKEARKMLSHLHNCGVDQNNELLFQFKSNRKFIIAFWACILGKIIPIPITFCATHEIAQKIVKIWDLVNHPFIFTDYPDVILDLKEHLCNPEPPQIISQIKKRVIAFDEINASENGKQYFINIDDIAFIQFSSGSTSSPKGVINTHMSLIHNISCLSHFFRLTKQDKTLSWLPLTHDMGFVFFHLLPLYNKADQYLMPPILFLAYPGLWLKKASEHKVTIIGSPNFGYNYYLEGIYEDDLKDLSLDSIKYIINGAEFISYDVCERFCEKLQLYGLKKEAMRPCYGLAEATLGVTTIPLNETYQRHLLHRNYLNPGDTIQFIPEADENSVSFVDLGIFDFTEVKITDNHGESVPEKTIGKIHIKGSAVTKGYYNNPEKTKELINNGWLYTGDIGFLYNNRLVIVGREKEIIIINGQNYYPQDIEKMVEQLSIIKSGHLIITGCVLNNTNMEGILCFVQYNGELDSFIPLYTAIQQCIQDKLGVFLNDIVPIHKIPKTTSGKIQRYKLSKAYTDGNYKTILSELKNKLLTSNIFEKIIEKNVNFTTLFKKLNENKDEKFESSELTPRKKYIQFDTMSKKKVKKIIKETLITNISKLLNKDKNKIPENEPLMNLGLTSLMITQLRTYLEIELNLSLSITVAINYPTIEKISDFLSEQIKKDKFVSI